ASSSDPNPGWRNKAVPQYLQPLQTLVRGGSSLRENPLHISGTWHAHCGTALLAKLLFQFAKQLLPSILAHRGPIGIFKVRALMREDEIGAGAVRDELDGDERSGERRPVHAHFVSRHNAPVGDDVLIEGLIDQRFAGDRRSRTHFHLGALAAANLEVKRVLFKRVGAAAEKPA